MSKAEERALEAYPEQDMFRSANHIQAQQRKIKRRVYREGYRQAEQDLALTTEDVSCIIHLADQFGKDYQKIADVFNKDREEEQK